MDTPSAPPPSDPNQPNPQPPSTPPANQNQPVNPVPPPPPVGTEPIPPKVESFLQQPGAQKPIEAKHTHKFFTYILIGVVVLLLIAAGVLGYFILQNQQQSGAKNNKVAALPTIPPTEAPTPVIDPTANWQTFSGLGFTVKYPNEWKVEKSAKSITIYDPQSGTETPNNGSGTVKSYKNVVTISTAVSTKTATKAADEYVAGLNNIEVNRQQKDINGFQAEIMDNQGEGSTGGKYILISDGKYLAQITASITDINGQSTENTILSTFTFATPSPAISEAASSTHAEGTPTQ